MSPPTIFENASHFMVQGSEFTNVGGDHFVVTNNYYQRRGRRNRLTNGTLNRRFRAIPLGDVFLLGTRTRVTDDLQGSLKVVRSYHPARVAGLGENTHTVVTYQGPDAEDTFRDDAQYSSLRHPNLAQLFGILHCNSSLIGTVFHSELVPLQYFAGLCASNPFAFSYLKYRFLVDSVAAAQITDSLHRYTPPDEYWMQPTSGLICLGPIGPSYNFHRDYENFYALWPRDPDFDQHTTIPQLDFKDYKSDENIIRHIEQQFDSLESFVGSHLGSKSVEVLFAEDSSPISVSFGSVISVSENDDHLTLVSRTLLAQAYFEHTSYSIGRWRSLHPEYDDVSMSLDEHNGWTRFTYSESSCQWQHNILSYFSLDLEAHIPSSDLEAAWLSQAGHILQDQTSDEYVFVGSKFKMILQARIPGSSSIPNPHSTCSYLFIAPVKVSGSSHPRFSFDKTPYFWSTDPSGAHRMSQQTQGFLGLPSFEIGIYEGRQWSDIEHRAISRNLKYKGFNPLGLDYARTRGYVSFEVMGCTDEQSSASIEALSPFFNLVTPSASIEIVSNSENSYEAESNGWELVYTSECEGFDGEDWELELIRRPQTSHLKPSSYIPSLADLLSKAVCGFRTTR
ncbi:hypothetical protein DFJ43DRAFT_322334 [Lentinula guzmanii]|uniref:Uncharacterized protein n=1 Tax=Lentinula guzmanii TaxID=2804957 RepID=A0AA38J9N5_9AGAR|nr:hypothetical protein DFJ43DRAFT_322334 [Lentinula guzmanii]